MRKSKKLAIVLATYLCAAAAVLGIFSFISWRNMKSYRLAARYAAQEAFEETVTAVDHMSAALKKSLYATDGSMSAKISAEVYADALAAETALSTLPFSTQELENISGYINQVGDYAYTLCSEAAAEGFTPEQAVDLAKLSELAGSLSNSLRALQGEFHNGAVTMDSGELRLANIGLDTSSDKLSSEFLRFESEFPRRASLEYDGKYSSKAVQAAVGKKLSDAEKLAVAASFAGVSPAEVKLAYSYEGAGGRRCYSAGDALIVVGDYGVESMGRPKLVSEVNIDLAQAQKTAEDFLAKRGYENLELISSADAGTSAQFKFAAVQDDAVCLDNFIKLSVALDDGAVCSFNATNYSAEKCAAKWDVSQSDAESALPDNVTSESVRKVIVHSDGGHNLSCYEFMCVAENGENVKIYVNAVTGRQSAIVV